MSENSAVKDTYLEGRRAEARARRENSAPAWLEFAGFKAAKGSYALAAMGYLNAGAALEAAGAHAADAYRQGFEVCVKGALKEPALFLAARLAGLLERCGDAAGAAAVYERLADFCESLEAFFLAADAGEHAAELLRMAGKDIRAYRRPAGLWLRNAAYWAENKNAGDEAWSRRRAELYLEAILK
ncbi:MAG TPA: hypothetical protein PKI19_08675 [Elusimicrobiales bacterium]|nr:hypothetical protein [Elusimicrobiales bacterium]